MSQTDVNVEAYNGFIQGLNLTSIYLGGAVAHLRRFPKGDTLSASVASEVSGPIALPEEPVGFQASIHYKLSLFDQLLSEGQEPPEPFAEVEAIWVAVYTSARIPDAAEFEIFSAQSLPLNLWPYFRQFVQQTVSQMGLPMLTLPAFKV